MIYCDCWCILETYIITIFRISYLLSIQDNICINHHNSNLSCVMKFFNMIKHKTAILHRLFETFLILLQKQIKKIFSEFVCISTDYGFLVIALIMNQMFCSPGVLGWPIISWHFQCVVLLIVFHLIYSLLYSIYLSSEEPAISFALCVLLYKFFSIFVSRSFVIFNLTPLTDFFSLRNITN